MTKEITGRKVLIITVSAFSVIIGVNVLLAVQAVETFPGLVVANSYVASQTFDAEKTAQEALGWTTSATISGGNLVFSVTDADGQPVQLASLDATLGRATNVSQDQTPDFKFADGVYSAPVSLERGHWNLRVKAYADDGTLFHQRIAIWVK